MAPHRIYHWKHGWVPLDHYAALKKAKGREAGARKYLAHSHAAGHAHPSVVAGEYGGGTHERGLQPVSAGHLLRSRTITAAFNPTNRRFALLDAKGRGRDGMPGTVATAVPEHLAEHFNAKGYRIKALHDDAGGHRVIVQAPSGELKSFKADGTDKEVVDAPPVLLKPVAAAKAGAPTSLTGHIQTHTVEVRTSAYNGQLRGRITPMHGYGGDTIHAGLAQHLIDNKYTVTGYERRIVTAAHPSGTVHRFKADGSNLHKPVVAKPPKVESHSVGGWTPIAPHEAIAAQSTRIKAIQNHKVKAAYRKGNKTVILEHNFTQSETEAFLGHVDQAFAATAQHTGHDITIHVPSGDRHMRTANGYVYVGDSSRVHINPQLVKNSAKPEHRTFNPGHYFMSGRSDAHPTVATLTHELGHIVDHRNGHTRDGRAHTTEASHLHSSVKNERGLSAYGGSNPAEGYAEAFAHHHLNGGSGIERHNAGASKYAAIYGWTPREPATPTAEAEITTVEQLRSEVFNATGSTDPVTLGKLYRAAERLGQMDLLRNWLRPTVLSKAQAAAAKMP